MFTTRTLIEILALPVGAALLTASILFVWTRGQVETSARHRLGGLVVAAAYMTGHLAHFYLPDWRNWQIIEAWQWLLPGVVFATLFVVADARLDRAWLRWVMRLLLAAGLTAITLQTFIRQLWTLRESIYWIGGLALGGTVWWALVQWSDRRMQRAWFAAHWLLVTIATAALLILSGTQKFFEMCVMLGAGLGAAVVLQCAGRMQLARGLHGVAPFVLLGLWINAYFYLEIDGWRIAVPAAAPLAAWAGSALPARLASRGWAVALVRLTAVLVVLASAVSVAVWQYEPLYSGY